MFYTSNKFSIKIIHRLYFFASFRNGSGCIPKLAFQQWLCNGFFAKIKNFNSKGDSFPWFKKPSVIIIQQQANIKVISSEIFSRKVLTKYLAVVFIVFRGNLIKIWDLKSRLTFDIRVLFHSMSNISQYQDKSRFIVYVYG